MTAGAAPAIELRDVRKSFGATEIIRGVSLSIGKGERHAIIGPNGAGKSTLFNLISGRFGVTSGDILLHGERVTGLRPFEINRKGLSRSFQITNIFHNMTVYENIRCGELWAAGYKYSFWHRVGGLRDVAQRTEEVMQRIGLTKRRNVLAGTLSYAEQRALEIGITIAGGANVILLDEPTAGMSRSETERAIELIRLVTEGKTLIMVEHDMGVVFGLADRISVLVYGEVIATGTQEQIQANTAVQEAYLGGVHRELTDA
jgi:branched-chain amino acid transport system ATP-binding protein